jgi:c-di-GMP-binding flagellar brake protein YcgR
MRNRIGAKIDKLALWDRLTLSLEKNGLKSEFVSRVENIKRNSYILEMPVRQSGKSNLQKGDIVEICYNKHDAAYTNLLKGDIVEICYNKHDAAYTFKASIKDLFIDESGSIEVKRESDTRREQRRKYVRLNISEDINFRILESQDSDIAGLSPEFQGSLLNISAGGFLFETEKKVKSDSLLIIKFKLKDRYSLENILAVVKRVEQSCEGLTLVGAEFITRENNADYGLEKLGDFLPQGTGTFDENLQRLIVQYIYNQQVKMRKEGKL